VKMTYNRIGNVSNRRLGQDGEGHSGAGHLHVGAEEQKWYRDSKTKTEERMIWRGRRSRLHTRLTHSYIRGKKKLGLKTMIKSYSGKGARGNSLGGKNQKHLNRTSSAMIQFRHEKKKIRVRFMNSLT